MLTDRRKQQLVAQATDQPDRALYGSLGAKTHRHLQVAADERSRREWAEVAAPGRSVRPRKPAPNTRWIPPALVAAGTLILGVGLWVWSHKTQELQASDVTRGELPPVVDTPIATASISGKGARSAASEQAAAEPAPQGAPEPSEVATPATASQLRTPRGPADGASSPKTAASGAGTAKSSISAPSSGSSSPDKRVPNPSKASAPSDQSIFKDAPF